MNKLHHTTQEGWAVHIYDCDRRLLCTLEPSHGWMFMAGLALGLTLGIIGYNLPQEPAAVPPQAPKLDIVAPLQID
ncbi:hypothetical protein VB780_24685 [Leptolyngbya sp. CCNP1308]|uniref:hypothetical protein n=1 Tax=Leptolyngbya sp. CCNP1308 TaxID=3110255 RepID=UPI002B21C3BA|nr:hypothetical protein [Leptolyngbya sp. CCNP1308]MEA5451796.1 hypothetical protein [Leptolyngbya sp. CCNP1308]